MKMPSCTEMTRVPCSQRKMASGVGVERIFPFNSPKVAKVEIVREGKVRRAKLYYLRKLSGKAARIKSKTR